jgi:hypothetical protein
MAKKQLVQILTFLVTAAPSDKYEKRDFGIKTFDLRPIMKIQVLLYFRLP